MSYLLDKIHDMDADGNPPSNHYVLGFHTDGKLYKKDSAGTRTEIGSTGLIVGTTPITSGTAGRILFEGSGNILQESGNLSYSSTNGLGLVSTNFTIDLTTTVNQLLIETQHVSDNGYFVMQNNIGSAQFGILASGTTYIGGYGGTSNVVTDLNFGIGTYPSNPTAKLHVEVTTTSGLTYIQKWENGSSIIASIRDDGRVNFSGLPTSSAGLASGDLWNDSGTIKII